MATVIEQAIKGKKKAMLQLYDGSKRKVYYIAKLLTNNEKAAITAINYAYRNVWGSIAAQDVATQEDFTHLVVEKVVAYCKAKAVKKDAKAFRVPQWKNFLITINKKDTVIYKTAAEEVLGELPLLQKYILVLYHVGGYSQTQLARVFKFSLQTVKIALEAEPTNVDRILQQYGAFVQTYDSVIGDILLQEQDIEVPASVDEYIETIIDIYIKPIIKRRRKFFAIIGAAALTVCIVLGGIAVVALGDSDDLEKEQVTESDTYEATDEDNGSSSESIISSPIIELDESLTYYADIEIADYGTITVQLDQNAAPVTVSNFVNLAQNGFYDGLTFHRIMEDFMMQGGDPNGDGTGGSDNNIVGEFADNGYENTLSHTRGAISMARSNEYDSASSQFFIVHEDSTSLDGQYAVFGYVSEGLDVVDAVCEAAEPTDDNGTIESSMQPIITSITIWTE